jgi:hypothetical protein
MATTAPLGIAAEGVVSRITVKRDVIVRGSSTRGSGRGGDRDLAAPMKSSGAQAGPLPGGRV